MFEVNVRTDAVDLYLHDFMHRAAARRLADYDVQVYRCSRYVWKTLWPIHKMVWCVYINLKCATLPHIEQKETTHHFTSRQQQGRGISTLYIRHLSGIPRADLHNFRQGIFLNRVWCFPAVVVVIYLKYGHGLLLRTLYPCLTWVLSLFHTHVTSPKLKWHLRRCLRKLYMCIIKRHIQNTALFLSKPQKRVRCLLFIFFFSCGGIARDLFRFLFRLRNPLTTIYSEMKPS